MSPSDSTVLAAPPIALPAELDPDVIDDLAYRRAAISGAFDHAREMTLQSRVHDGQVGVHVITPFRTSDGLWLVVDRGWVPLASADPATRPEGQVVGPVRLEGVLRPPPRPGRFTPDNRPTSGARGQWYWIDIAAMSRAAGVSFLPILVEVGPAPNPGGLPIGGRTRTDIPNNHLQYAITWYALAVALAVIAGLFCWRHGRAPPGEDR